MKPIHFSWVKSTAFSSLVRGDVEFVERVKASLNNLESYLEELANQDKWDEIEMAIPYNQLSENDITVNDAGDEDRMFVFAVLNNASMEYILESVCREHYTHLVYLDLIDSLKG